MCTACIDVNDPKAPPVSALIAAIERQLRRLRRVKWGARAAAAVAGVFMCYFMVLAFGDHQYMLMFAALDGFLAWAMLHLAEEAAKRADEALLHLRMTEAMLEAE